MGPINSPTRWMQKVRLGGAQRPASRGETWPGAGRGRERGLLERWLEDTLPPGRLGSRTWEELGQGSGKPGAPSQRVLSMMRNSSDAVQPPNDSDIFAKNCKHCWGLGKRRGSRPPQTWRLSHSFSSAHVRKKLAEPQADSSLPNGCGGSWLASTLTCGA